MSSPFRYFRAGPENMGKFGKEAGYYVVAGEPHPDDTTKPANVRRTGEIGVEYTPEKYTANVGTDSSHRYHHLAESLGVHPDLITNVLRDEVRKHYEMYGDHSDNYDFGRTARLIMTNRGDWGKPPANPNFQKHVEELSADPRFYPETLFDTEPAKLEITDAFVSPSMRVALGTLVGLARNDFPNGDIVPSSNLSVHSSKVAQNAMQKGIITKNPENPRAEVSNGLMGINNRYTELDENNNPKYLPGTEIPRNEVVAAQKTYKGMLRGTPARNAIPITENGLGHQFIEYPLVGIAHPVLPGMEESFGKVMKRSDWSNIDK